jgi:nitrite reductase/ring-hydroxylating ferredoxin subunit
LSLIDVTQVSQIPPGVMKSFSAGDKQVLIASYESKYYCIENKCPHAGGNLSEGKLEGNIVTCPVHGSRFDITTGKCVSGPKIGIIRLKAMDVPAYEIKVEGNMIKVDIQGSKNT